MSGAMIRWNRGLRPSSKIISCGLKRTYWAGFFYSIVLHNADTVIINYKRIVIRERSTSRNGADIFPLHCPYFSPFSKIYFPQKGMAQQHMLNVIAVFSARLLCKYIHIILQLATHFPSSQEFPCQGQ